MSNNSSENWWVSPTGVPTPTPTGPGPNESALRELDERLRRLQLEREQGRPVAEGHYEIEQRREQFAAEQSRLAAEDVHEEDLRVLRTRLAALREPFPPPVVPEQYYSYDDDYITSDKVFYDNAEGYQAEACYQDNNGKRYIFLSIDDYNKNFAKSLISPFENSVINDINIFAKINNYYDTFNYSNGDVDYQFKRSYFGPVDIMKFRVRLLDEFGREIDLNNGDFSFTMRIEQLYDST